MKRTLTLRKIQLLESLKYSVYIVLGLLLLAILIMVASYLTGGGMNFNHSSSPLFLDILGTLALLFSCLTFIIPISDGTSHFDAALRFGLNRKYYFITNVFVYLILAGLSLFFTPILKMDLEWTGSALSYIESTFNQLNWTHYFMTLDKILLYALVSYAFYKFGWKILIPIIAIPFISGLLADAVSSSNILNNMDWIMKMIDFISNHLTEMLGLVSVFLFSIYYLFINRFDAQG